MKYLIIFSVFLCACTKQVPRPKDPDLHVAYAYLPECSKKIKSSKHFVKFQGDDGAYLFVSNKDGSMCLDRSGVKQ